VAIATSTRVSLALNPGYAYAGYARHANFAGILVIGLGCEANQMDALFFAQGMAEGPLLRAMAIQDKGGTAKCVAEGIDAVKAMLPHANRVQREAVAASHLMVGLQCGGSDGYSGITANPALGAAVDLPVRHGGPAILSETPGIDRARALPKRSPAVGGGSRGGGARKASRGSAGGGATPRGTTAR